ncbi:MAG TPA: RiPP maturation radical SAM protein 1 [Desulfobulbus sp.]|nr:RiPP maturation radical SAM protein 1 [Desulfobulbus sp.]
MRISLVSMPWAIFNRPSVQLGALQAYLKEQFPGDRIDTHHPYLSAAAAIGLERYRTISENPWAGEALYSSLFFPQTRERAKKLFDRQKRDLADQFDAISERLAADFHSWLAGQDFSDCDLLGLSICFSQLIPSLYAAGEVKKRYPELPILFGGSTCTPAVGTSLLQTFSAIDYILTGEGEQPLAALIRHLKGEAPFPNKKNILRRKADKKNAFSLQNHEQKRLENLPTPDYDDYFRELTAREFSFIPELPIEFSRGCWWNKCSFCNLNLQWCGYRYKRHQKILAEVEFLAERHKCLDFFFTDNALPLKEARSFFQKTAEKKTDLQFFAEIRAPKSAKECTTYRHGGLRTIQVGIEALSDSLLQRMCKGTSVIENIAAMKFAAAADIRLDGNLILEFPGSTDREVEETLAVLEAVLPYRPLQAAGFFLGQGSPVSRTPRQFGIRAITHHPNNRLLFPKEILLQLDLLIKGYRGDRAVQKKRWIPVRRKLTAWHNFHQKRCSNRPVLSMRDGGTFLILRQERPDLPTLRHRLKGLSRKIYLACEEPVTRKELLERFKTIKEEQLTAFLNGLCRQQLIYCDATHCLALAIKETSMAGPDF